MENPSMDDRGINSLLQIKQLFKTGDIAGIIIEGSSGTAGSIFYPDKYLKALEDICRQHGVLIICDEVMSGWGRTGEIFAYMKHKIEPDIITTAKGITNGYVPLGAVIVKNNIAEIYNNKPFLHGLTYFAHPLSCTIANRCLDIYLENNRELIKHANLKGIYLNILGNKLCDSTDVVYEYRNDGLLGCIELKIKNETILKQISDKLLENNIYCFRRNNYIYTAPPLTISIKLLEETMNKIQDILQKYYVNY
jgi:taurine--2-oxoglutarate transaminase